MELKDYLTNERIAKKFKSQFDLVSYAIRLAENMIHTGRDCRVKTDVQNRSMQVLVEILNNKDRFDEIIEEKPEHEENMTPYSKNSLSGRESFSSKGADKKKARRVLLDESVSTLSAE